jgi:hypothetical protein
MRWIELAGVQGSVEGESSCAVSLEGICKQGLSEWVVKEGRSEEWEKKNKMCVVVQNKKKTKRDERKKK